MTAIMPGPQKGEGISLLVPFRADNGIRQETWDWLRRYWDIELPGAEIILGTNEDTPFCKTAAVNGAAAKATGDVIAILDADCYMPGDVLQNCAEAIRAERGLGRPLWYVPYTYFYRFTEPASRMILDSDPANPPRYFAAAPPDSMLMPTDKRGGQAIDSAIVRGHWYGALIQLMPREAFDTPGGMDERFRGWGGEDVAFMFAIDTLFGKHKTTPNGVIHLWHPSLMSPAGRVWQGQEDHRNGDLTQRYAHANGDYAEMKTLVNGG